MGNDAGKMKEFGERYAAAWCSQDAASVAAFFSPTGWLSVNGGAAAMGQIAIAEVAQSFMTAFPDMRVAMDELRELGDRTEFHWTLSGTNNGPGGTGKRVRICGFESWKIGEDGRIASSEGQFDDAEYQRQLREGA